MGPVSLNNLPSKSRELSDGEREEKKAKVVFNNPHEIQRISILPQSVFQNELPHAPSLFLAVQDGSQPGLNSIAGKLKPVEKGAEQVLQEIEVVKNKLLHPGKYFYTLRQLDGQTPQTICFWKQISEILTNDPTVAQIEIEGVGCFEVQILRVMIDLTIQVAPQKLKKFLNALAYPGAPPPHVVISSLPPLHIAAISGREDGVARELPNMRVDTLDKRGHTPLLWATLLGNRAVVAQLLRAGASPSTLTVLHATASGDPDILKLYLQAGANANAADKQKCTPLLYAASVGNLEMTRVLLEHGVDVNTADKNNWTPLMHAVSIGNVEMTRLLLEHGADVNATEKNNWTPLMFATRNGNVEIVKILLVYGANVNAVNKGGATVLILLKTLRPPHWKLTRELIEAFCMQKTTSYAKSYKGMKLASHAFQIEGTAHIQDREIDFMGHRPEHNAHKMANSILEFSRGCPHLLDANTARHLAQSLYFAADQMSHTPAQILARIRRGMPTIVLGGYKEHSTTDLYWKSRHIHCNMINLDRLPIEIHRYDQNKIDVETVKLQYDLNGATESLEQYKNVQYKILPEKLAFTKTEIEKLIEPYIQLPLQIAANCSWACLENIVKVFLFLSRTNDVSNLSTEDLRKIRESVANTFATWIVFQQMQLLEKYMDQEYDEQLVLQAFTFLWNAKSGNPKIFENLPMMLENLEEKYRTVAPDQLENLRTCKAWRNVVPHTGANKSVLSVLETASVLLNSMIHPVLP